MPNADAPTFVANLLRFGRVLRAAHFDIPVGSLLDLIDALPHVNLADREEVFYACRAILVRRHEQLQLFAQLFDVFWRDHTNPYGGRDAGVHARDTQGGAAALAALASLASGPDVAKPADAGSEALAFRTWSDLRALARKDFAEFTDEEIARARAALDQLSWLPGLRRTRRWTRGRGARMDLRGAIARSIRTGGLVLTLPTRRRRLRPRRLVLLCDVSGSMERYSRLLIHFAHGIGQRHRLVEVFVFSTELTRITRQLRPRHIGSAAAAVSTAVPGWSGGTRIGPALRQFHRQWARRVMRENPVVLLISDGWDRGDPDLLREQVARLQRSCHRLIWLNPLIGTTGFEPLTRGLQAALPYVDDFLPARTLADLGDLALHLEAVGTGQRREPLRERR